VTDPVAVTVNVNAPLATSGVNPGPVAITLSSGGTASLVSLNLANSGAIGGANAAATVSMDHTSLIQTYINAASAAALAINIFAVAVIDVPALYYRVQNLNLPGNVKLRSNGGVFRYVDPSLSPPSGFGNFVMTHNGNYNQTEGLVIFGNGTAQPNVGGIWCMPGNVNGSGNPRAYKNIFRDVMVDNFGHRGVFDQGTNTIWKGGLIENVLLSQTAPPYFLGAYETAGTDTMMSQAEITPSVVGTLGGIQVPRAPTQYLQTALTTTNGSISLPLSSGTITLNSTAALVATGGAVLIGGTLIAYTGVSGATLTGCTSGGSGTITTGTNVYAPIGFCAALVIGGTADWVTDTDAEIGDISVFLGPAMFATCLSNVTITTTPQSITVDSTNHIIPTGGTLQVVNNQATSWSATQLLYTSTSGGTTINGVTVASGSTALTNGQAILGPFNPTQTHTSMLRGDFSMTHSWIVGPGSGRHSGAEALRCAETADNIYYGFYSPAGSNSNWDFITLTADSTSMVNRFQFAIVDQNSSSANYNRWTTPRPLNCHLAYFTGNTSGGWFTIASGPGAALGTGATPNVADGTAFTDANVGATTITNFAGGVNGQEFTFLQGVNTTIANNANIVTKSGANITPPGAGFAALRFRKIGFNVSPTPAWYQI